MRSDNGGQERDLERIRYVAANYEHLQGLRKVPLGIFLLVLAAVIVLSWFWSEIGGRMVPSPYVVGLVAAIFVLFIAGIVLPHFISIHYERRYGTVQRFRPVARKRMVLYVTMVLALILGGTLPLLAMGVAMMVAYWPERRFQGHYVVIGAVAVGVFLAYAASIAVYLATNGGSWPTGGTGFVLPSVSPVIFVAAYLIVGGVLDYLLLVRTMKTAPEESDAGAV